MTIRAAARRVGVVNVGLPLFADAVRAQGRPAVQVDWRVPAGGDPEALAALRRLYGRAERAGRRGQRARWSAGWTPACRCCAACARPREVVPELDGARLLLHGGPPLVAARRVRPAAPVDAGRGGGGGLGRRRRRRPTRCCASGEVRSWRRPTRSAAVVPMAAAVGPSTPVWVVDLPERRAVGRGRRSTRGRATCRGSAGTRRRRIERLGSCARRWGRCWRRRSRRATSPVDVLSLAAQARRDGRRRARAHPGGDQPAAAHAAAVADRPRSTRGGRRWRGSCRPTTCSS